MTGVAIWLLRKIDILGFVFSVSGYNGGTIEALSGLHQVEFAYPIQSFDTLVSAEMQWQKRTKVNGVYAGPAAGKERQSMMWPPGC